MIYDCFTFFNELDLLEIRLNVLKDVVDKFVLVEAGETHTGKPKPLIFNENRKRFAAFADRIIYVQIKQFPPVCTTTWARENFQRNAVAEGLKDAKADDTILISDLDEIPRPEAIRKHIGHRGITVFDQTYYAYYLNYHNVRQQWWHGTRMLTYHDFCHCFDGLRTIKNEILPESVNAGTTASKIRCRILPRSRGGQRVAKNAGWHFTSLGGAQAVAKKIASFAHQEYNPGDDNIRLADIEKMIQEGKGPFWEMRCFGVPLDASFPQYILDNREKYAHLIFNVTPEYIRTNRFDRFVQTLRGKAIGFAERTCPAAVHNWLHLVKLRLSKR